jgi:hypothetical protein
VHGLAPATLYQLRVTAHNAAGSSTAEFSFSTLTKDGGRCDNDNTITLIPQSSIVYTLLKSMLILLLLNFCTFLNFGTL